MLKNTQNNCEPTSSDVSIDFNTLDYSKVTSFDMPTETTQSIAEMCGIAGTIKLIEHFGGQLISIPIKKRTSLYRRVVEVCGKDYTHKLFTSFAGENILLPVRSSVLDTIIDQLLVDGEMNKEMLHHLIYRYNCTGANVYRTIRAKKHGHRRI